MTKFKHLALLLLAAVVVFGCSKYDDTDLRNDVSDLQSRVEKLETWCTTVNGQISALQGLVTALQANDYVTGVSPVTVGGKTGYTITFAKSGAITIFNGKDGANGSDGTNGTNGKDGIDGATPTISVAKGEDDAYYWTVNGEWLTVGGKKVPTTGAAAQTPSLSIDKEGDAYYWKLNGSWLLATDGTKVPATGAKGDKGDAGASGSQGTAGTDGDSVFKKNGITVTDDSVTFTLADGKDTSFTLPRTTTMVIFGDLTAIKTMEARDITLALNIKDADYAAIKAEIVNSKGMNVAFATRAAQAPWTVAIKQVPAFGTDGSIATQPIVTVTPPAMDADTDTDAALLKVAIVDKGGKEHSATIVVQYGKAYFANANLVAALKEAIPGLEVKDGDINPGSAVNKALIESTKDLRIASKDIASLQGIEYFTALEKLFCSSNRLASLDLSKNTKLTILSCNLNIITTLVLPNTETLEEIQCYGNGLTSLDVSKCTGLKGRLVCNNNALTSLDVSNCTKLTELTCRDNKLTSLDVSKNTALTLLSCTNNQLSTLDISTLSSLDFRYVVCGKQTDGAGADRTLTLTVTAEQKDQFRKDSGDNTGVIVNEKAEGPTWATGNLVAKADGSGCEIGAPTDGGLFFQFGSLVGWSATGDDPTVAVRPNGFNGKEGWTETGKIWQGTTGTVPFTVKDSGSDDEKAGIGDPCRYYLGETWRLPTKDEYVALFKDDGYPNGTWKWENSSATNTTAGLTFPASGYRLYLTGILNSVGTLGYYWSASPYDASLGYDLTFASSYVNPSINYPRASGLPVRCVRD